MLANAFAARWRGAGITRRLQESGPPSRCLAGPEEPPVRNTAAPQCVRDGALQLFSAPSSQGITGMRQRRYGGRCSKVIMNIPQGGRADTEDWTELKLTQSVEL